MGLGRGNEGMVQGRVRSFRFTVVVEMQSPTRYGLAMIATDVHFVCLTALCTFADRSFA